MANKVVNGEFEFDLKNMDSSSQVKQKCIYVSL